MNRRNLLQLAGGLTGYFILPPNLRKSVGLGKEELKQEFPHELNELIGSQLELLDENGNVLLYRKPLRNTFKTPFEVEQRVEWEIGTKMTLFPVAVAIYGPDNSLVRVAKIPNPTLRSFVDTKYPDTLTIITSAILTSNEKAFVHKTPR